MHAAKSLYQLEREAQTVRELADIGRRPGLDTAAQIARSWVAVACCDSDGQGISTFKSGPCCCAP